MTIHITRRTILHGLAGGAAFAVGGCAAVGRAGPALGNAAKPPLPGLQLYMLGDAWVRDPSGTFAVLAATGYREIELPQVPADADAIAVAAREAGLAIASVHLGSGRFAPKGRLSLDSGIAEIVDALGKLGAAAAVLPMMPAPASASFSGSRPFGAALQAAVAAEGADYWKRLAAWLNERGAALASHGIAIGYHNHNIEFAPVADTTGFDLLLSHCDAKIVRFELDIGWVTTAGLDPAALLDRLKGRAALLHLKDVAAGTPVNFALETKPAIAGTGIVDWPRVLAAARRAGVRHAFVEQEPPFSIARIEAANRNFAYFDRMGFWR